MTARIDISDYEALHVQQDRTTQFVSSALGTGEDNLTSNIGGGVSENIIFDLAEADATLDVDPSFALVVAELQGLSDVSAVATITMAVADVSGLFSIIVDSNDLDDVSSSDVKFMVNSNNPFSDLSFSMASVKWGTENINATGQLIKQDMVRHMAKDITGGYAVADIFTNEAELVADISDNDDDLRLDISNAITLLYEDSSGADIDASSAEAATDANRLVYTSMISLFKIVMQTSVGSDDTAKTRFLNFLDDLSNHGLACDENGHVVFDASHVPVHAADVSGYEGDVSGAQFVKAPLTFIAGDAIAIRILYTPNTTTPIGNNPIHERTYKVLVELV